MQVGIISPTMIGIIPSIEMILWVAIGGRATLVGPVLGAILMNSAKTFFSESFPDFWLFILGAVFVIVVIFFTRRNYEPVSEIQKKGREVCKIS